RSPGAGGCASGGAIVGCVRRRWRMCGRAVPRCVIGAGMRGAGGANGMRVDRCNATSIRM
ncbi:hypothetical protein ACX841_08155, partial [Burkholderia pseudomallei]